MKRGLGTAVPAWRQAEVHLADVGAASWSFIVPAWNEEALLGETLDAIHRAGPAAGIDYEIIVADDASTDATPDIATRHGAVVVTCHHRQIAATRNTGAAAATGDVLVFVDADTRVTEGAVRGVVTALEDGAVYGGADVTWDGHIPLWSKCLLRMTLRLYRLRGLASGAFLFCTREAFEAAGRFDETVFAAEEYLLSLALKRQGPHAWIPTPVITSGRKLRSHSARELLGETARLFLRGKKGLADRSHLRLWYEPRRPDPAAGTDAGTGVGKPR